MNFYLTAQPRRSATLGYTQTHSFQDIVAEPKYNPSRAYCQNYKFHRHEKTVGIKRLGKCARIENAKKDQTQCACGWALYWTNVPYEVKRERKKK